MIINSKNRLVTVAELIEALKKFPQDLPICFHDSYNEGDGLVKEITIETATEESWGIMPPYCCAADSFVVLEYWEENGADAPIVCLHN